MSGLPSRYVERIRWEQAYDEAFARRDWQMCEILMEEKPEPLPWLVEKFVHLATGAWIR